MGKIRMNYPQFYEVQVPKGGRKRVRAKRHNRKVRGYQERQENSLRPFSGGGFVPQPPDGEEDETESQPKP
jgi:hypothetical protein